uniref:Putative tail tubular protein n=1 Tax=viral metagenome TaxID=1070528 RepID=A0A6M3JC27_9ZZZZ
MYTSTDKMFDVVVQGLSSGSITLTASTAIFDAEHVGALWRLTHPVDSNTVQAKFTSNVVPPNAGVADQYSASLAVAKNQDFTVTTSGYWYGVLYVQKSYDGGINWINVYPFTSRSGLENLSYSATETVDDADYRLKMTAHVGYYAHRDEIYWTFDYTMVSVGYQKQGIVKITAFTNATNTTATVLYPLGGTTATYLWAEGAWSNYRGFPRAVCFYQNRLFLAGTAYQPNMLWGSQSSDFENMSLGSGLDNEAIAREIGAAGQNPIMWIKDKKGIYAGTTGAVIKIGTPGSKYVLTPSTISSERAVETGACSIQPGLTGSSIVYVDRNRRKVRDLKYDVASDDMLSPDLTIFSDDITEPNILEMAWQKRPDERGWFVRGDGNMVTLSYNPAQGVEAWTEIVTDGNYVSVCVIPGVDEDEVWVAVVRDSNDYVMIEKFHNQNWVDDVWFVDSGLEYTGVATTTLTGLDHLEGESVQVYSNVNGYVGDFTVASGTITLATSETQAIAGLGYTATIKTFPIEVSTQLGPSVGVLKNIRLLTLCLYESEGGRYGYDTMYDILYPSYTTDFFTGLTRLGMDTGYQMEAFLIIDQNEPLPLGITGIAINKYELSTDN